VRDVDVLLSQYLVIWYGNVPWRPLLPSSLLRGSLATMAFVIFIAGWLIPFAYLLKRLTGRPPAAHKPLVVILFMGWTAIFLERALLVYPPSKVNVFPHRPPRSWSPPASSPCSCCRNRFLARYGSRLDQAGNRAASVRAARYNGGVISRRRGARRILARVTTLGDERVALVEALTASSPSPWWPSARSPLAQLDGRLCRGQRGHARRGARERPA
jgi:hypothetical protein